MYGLCWAVISIRTLLARYHNLLICGCWRHHLNENDSRFCDVLSDNLNGNEAAREITMTLKEMEFTLKTSRVDTEDIGKIISHYKKSRPTLAELDEMLEKLGYNRVFTDELFGWIDEEEDEYDDSFSHSEKNHHKPQWVE